MIRTGGCLWGAVKRNTQLQATQQVFLNHNSCLARNVHVHRSSMVDSSNLISLLAVGLLYKQAGQSTVRALAVNYSIAGSLQNNAGIQWC